MTRATQENGVGWAGGRMVTVPVLRVECDCGAVEKFHENDGTGLGRFMAQHDGCEEGKR